MCISIARRPASPERCAASSIARRWALPWGWARSSASRLRKRWGIRPTAINSESRDLAHASIRQDPAGLPDLPERGGRAGVVAPAAVGMSPEQGRPAAAPDGGGQRDQATRKARPGRIEAIYIRPGRRGETVAADRRLWARGRPQRATVAQPGGGRQKAGDADPGGASDGV